MIRVLDPRRYSAAQLGMAATVAALFIIYTVAACRYDHFCSWGVFARNLVGDNASLGLCALGMTLVIISGGIDLSVGAVLAFASILLADLIVKGHLAAGVAVPIVLAVGGLGGALMGWIIHWFRLPPFLVTLGGMFLARGLALALTEEKRLGLSGVPLYESLSSYALLGLPFPALVFLAALAAVALLAGWTRFGRTIYAIGGNEQSALLMGLAVGRTKVLVYALSGLLAAAAGVVHALSNGAGDAAVGSMFELDAIAAVVIGGTLLSGGVGSVLGTFLGLLILAVIQTAIYFEGTLSSWWTKIVIGALLLGFILLQRLCALSLRARTAA